MLISEERTRDDIIDSRMQTIELPSSVRDLLPLVYDGP